MNHTWVDSASHLIPSSLPSIVKGRSLYEEYDDPNTKSNKCKTECIDEGFNYCPDSIFQGGKCCAPDEACPRYEFCTYDNKKAPLYFKYLACPNEDACEEKVIIPNYDGEVLKRAVDKYEYKFVKDDVCSYIVYAPWQMTQWDKMYIKIYNIKNAEVYLAKGFGYKWLNHLDQMVNEGDVFDTAAEWQFYVVGVADSMFKGTFSMKIWVEQNEEPKAKTPEKVIEKDEP